MHILIVGNILKNVYLNLDSRTENFETDKNSTSWLNLGFNSSAHYFFNRHSSFGGATISMEVFQKMGLESKISGSRFELFQDDAENSIPAADYRYILVADNGVSYLLPNNPRGTTFSAPNEAVDYIYVDRSANLSKLAASRISAYLDDHPNTKLILYFKNFENIHLNSLENLATLIFAEKNPHTLTKARSLPEEKTIYISEDLLTYHDVATPITTERIDKLTHLSAFSIAAATVIGGFIIGESVENSLEYARTNLENSTLDSTLSLDELKNLAHQHEDLNLIAASLFYPGKGILAADESGGSIKKKFAELNIPDTFENRHDYRNIFFTTPDIEEYLSGVILFDETARDYADNGHTYIDYLTSKRIIPGIKVDEGLEKFPDSEETYTKGLEDLPRRLREYHEMGLRFAKWRAAFNLTLDQDCKILTPSDFAIEENCRILAEYATKCQSAGIVPIVEPELVYDGNYSLDQSAEATSRVLDTLMKTLQNFGVNLRACVLKVNMVIAGKQYGTPSTPEEVGHATAEILKNHVPAELAGIVFLSGGQTPEQATANLAAVLQNGPFPWPITFSFARALQDPALHAWAGNNDNFEIAKKAFQERLEENAKIL